MYCDPYETVNATGIIVPLSCPSGHYCPAGTGQKYSNPCPAGTYGLSSLESQSKEHSDVLYYSYVGRMCVVKDVIA